MRAHGAARLHASWSSLARQKLDRAVEVHATKVERNPALRLLLRPSLRRLYGKRDTAADAAVFEHLRSRQFMPSAVLVQISRKCNLRCVMCGWAVWGRNKGFMSMELYKHILGELKSNQIATLNLSNPQGEPLLHPQAAEFIRLAIDEGLHVYINSNCTTLGDRKSEQLVELCASGKLEVNASFSGYDRETHESVYVGSKFEHSSAKLKAFNARLTEKGLERHLTINGIILDRATLRRHVDYLVSLGISEDRICIGLPDNFAGIVKVGKRRAGGMFSYKENLPYRGLRLCNLLAYYVLIYDDGKVSACSCRDSEGVMEIGDITKESLFDIRNGPRFMGMMQAFMKRDISNLPLCLNCDIPYGDYENEKLFFAGAERSPS